MAIITVSAALILASILATSSGLALNIQGEQRTQKLNLIDLLEQGDSGNSMMKCDGGEFVGVEDFMTFLQFIVRECKGPLRADATEKSQIEFYNCLVDTMGMTERHTGRPMMDKIETFHRMLVSEQILGNIYDLGDDGLESCAIDYVLNFELSDEDRKFSGQTYFKCLMENVFLIIGFGEQSGNIHKALCR